MQLVKRSIILSMVSLLSVSSFSLAETPAATQEAGKAYAAYPVSEKERVDMFWSFGAMAVVSAAIKLGGNRLEIAATAQSLLHASNVLYNLGTMFEKPVLKDYAARILLVTASAKLAGSEGVKSLVPSIPLIGEDLVKAGPIGNFVVYQGIYSSMAKGWEILCERTPMGSLISGKVEL